MHTATGGPVQETHAHGLWGRVERSMLHTGVPEMGKRGRYSMLQAGDRQNPPGGPQGKDNYPKDGVSGSSQLSEAGKKDKGGIEDTVGGKEVLYRLIGGPGHAPDGILQVQRILGGKSERAQSK